MNSELLLNEIKGAVDRVNTKLTEQDGKIKAFEEDLYQATKRFNTSWRSRGSEDLETAKENLGLALACVAGNQSARTILERRNIDTKGLAESVTSTGGALVPDVLVGNLIVLLEAYGVFRRNVRIVPMSSDTQGFPKLDAEITIYCPGEAGTITDSAPTLSNVSLVAKKFAGLCAVSTELDEDSVLSVASIVGESFARAMAGKEDLIGFRGDGTSTYFGMTGIAGAFQTLTGWNSQSANAALGGLVTAAGNAYSEITLDNFETVMSVLPERFEAGAKWYMSKKFWGSVILPLLETNVSAQTYIELLMNPRKNFLGYPVEFTSAMPSAEANSQIVCFLGDLTQGVYLGERRALKLEQSRDVYFASDQLAIRGTERIAINACGIGDTTNAGPVCALITLAS